MEGYTDTRGDITFAMLNTVKYNVTFTKSGYSFIPMLITAKAENYIIEGYSTSGIDIPFIQNGTSTAATFNFTVTTNRTSQHGANVTVYFNDTSFRTVSGYVVIWQSNHTLGNPLNTNRTEFYNATFTGFQTVKEWVVPLSNTSVDGESYVAEVVATSPLKTNTVNQPVWFKKTPQRIGGMSSEFSLFFALAIMMFTALMAGSSSVGAVGLCVTFEGWIFYAIGFLDLIDQQMSSGAYSVPAILTIMTFVSFMALFVAGKKKR
jgi:hypothetical protein